MVTIRPYQESDAAAVGILIADTFGEFNLGYASEEERAHLLGPFLHARSPHADHRAAITNAIHAAVVLVAEADGQIVGVLRGRPDKLQSLFVAGAFHRQGIGRRLVDAFEQACARQGAGAIKLMATLYAVPFYEAVGYKKSTGVRTMKIFGTGGFPYQPMKKRIGPAE